MGTRGILSTSDVVPRNIDMELARNGFIPRVFRVIVVSRWLSCNFYFFLCDWEKTAWALLGAKRARKVVYKIKQYCDWIQYRYIAMPLQYWCRKHKFFWSMSSSVVLRNLLKKQKSRVRRLGLGDQHTKFFIEEWLLIGRGIRSSLFVITMGIWLRSLLPARTRWMLPIVWWWVKVPSVFSTKGDMAVGPDDFNTAFSHNWGVVGNDSVLDVKSFFCTGFLLKWHCPLPWPYFL